MKSKIEVCGTKSSQVMASNLVCSISGEFGMIVVCSKCFNPEKHRHTGAYSKKDCQA